MGTNRKDRIIWLDYVYQQQKQRVFAAKGTPIKSVMCECALRKLLKEPLDKWMESECKGAVMLDHIDNNHKNNNPKNHQALCRSHNFLKNPPINKRDRTSYANRKIKRLDHSHERTRERRHKSSQVIVNQYQSDGQPAIVRYKELEKNLTCEPLAIRFIKRIMAKRHEIKYKDLIDSIAFASHCSQQTASRYLDKQCAPIGGNYKIDYINGDKMVLRRGKDEYEQRPTDLSSNQIDS